MKILWFVRNFPTLGVQFEGEFNRSLEKVIGKDNIVFYGKPDLAKQDPSGFPFYPETFKLIGEKTFPEIVKEEHPDIAVLQDKYFDTRLINEAIIPRILILEDSHYEWYNVAKIYLDRKEIDMIFTRSYGDGVGFRIKQKCPVGYKPYSVPTNMFYDKGLERVHDVYLTGTVPVIYPIRVVMCYEFFHKIGGVYNPFSYQGMNGIADGKTFNYSQYFEALNTSKLAMFDGGMFKGAIMKYFECMACNTLVLADLPHDYKALRFEPNENIIEINFENFVEKMKEYVQNESERKRIAKNGMELTMKYHTTDERAKQLLAQFEEVVAAKNEGRIFDYRNVKGEAGRMLSILEQDADKFNKNNLHNKCMDNGLRPDYDVWHNKAYHIWDEIKSGRATISKWIDYIKETQ
jgi:hypothetical protein